MIFAPRILLLIFAASLSFADQLQIRCKAGSSIKCDSLVGNAVLSLGCRLASPVECRQPIEDPSAFYCSLLTENCMEPRADMFLTTTCFAGSKASLRKQNRLLSLTWMMGPFNRYVTDICVQ